MFRRSILLPSSGRSGIRQGAVWRVGMLALKRAVSGTVSQVNCEEVVSGRNKVSLLREDEGYLVT
jgi:hypothetical protein